MGMGLRLLSIQGVIPRPVGRTRHVARCSHSGYNYLLSCAFLGCPSVFYYSADFLWGFFFSFSLAWSSVLSISCLFNDTFVCELIGCDLTVCSLTRYGYGLFTGVNLSE